MSYVIPLEQPLSESQSKLLAQVGSMKNLSDMPFFKKIKIKKDEEISLFDYLLKVLKSMGIDSQLVLKAFLDEFFSTEKMVDFILTATAKLSTAMYKNLNTNSSTSFVLDPNNKMTDKQISELIEINYNWLYSQDYITNPLKELINVLRINIIQELMIIIFGKPKKTENVIGQNGMVADLNRLNELIDESLCGGVQIFNVSKPVGTNFGDLEYNRIQKVEQSKNGNLTFKITCQGANISMPDDPMFLFKDVPPGFQGGQSVSPQSAIENIFNFVNNQIQKNITGDNKQSNSKTSEKTFTQNFLETLISSITCLISPFFVGFVGTIPGQAQGVSQEALNLLEEGLLNIIFPNSVYVDPNTGKKTGEFVPATSCEIINSYDKNNMNQQQKKKVALMTILCNLLLNMAIGFILSYVLEKLKNMIKKYIVKRAQAKIERKIEKMKKKYETSIIGRTVTKIEKTAQQARLLEEVIKIIQPKKNSSIPTINN